jgi:hypothetical protein
MARTDLVFIEHLLILLFDGQLPYRLIGASLRYCQVIHYCLQRAKFLAGCPQFFGLGRHPAQDVAQNLRGGLVKDLAQFPLHRFLLNCDHIACRQRLPHQRTAISSIPSLLPSVKWNWRKTLAGERHSSVKPKPFQLQTST